LEWRRVLSKNGRCPWPDSKWKSRGSERKPCSSEDGKETVPLSTKKNREKKAVGTEKTRTPPLLGECFEILLFTENKRERRALNAEVGLGQGDREVDRGRGTHTGIYRRTGKGGM